MCAKLIHANVPLYFHTTEKQHITWADFQCILSINLCLLKAEHTHTHTPGGLPQGVVSAVLTKIKTSNRRLHCPITHCPACVCKLPSLGNLHAAGACVIKYCLSQHALYMRQSVLMFRSLSVAFMQTSPVFSKRLTVTVWGLEQCN